MTEEELNEHYPWKVDQLVRVVKPDGRVTSESIYKDEDAAIPQPRRDRVGDGLKKHVIVTMTKEIANKVRCIKNRSKFKSLLIVGPTGSGKTSLASAIANTLDQPSFFYDSWDLVGRWRNSAGVNIRKIFNNIQQDQPQTIVIDNLESVIVRHNDGGDNGVHVLGGFLDMFERCESSVTVIGITNNNVSIPWKLRYRFWNIIDPKLPNAEQREQAFAYHMKQEAEDLQKDLRIRYAPAVTAAILAQKTSGLDYYTLQNIVSEMCEGAWVRQHAARQSQSNQETVVEMKDAMKSIDAIKPYAALARKLTYYSAIAAAVCATLYVFKSLFFNAKNSAKIALR